MRMYLSSRDIAKAKDELASLAARAGKTCGYANHCPVAQMINRHLKPGLLSNVTASYIHLLGHENGWRTGTRFVCNTPQSAVRIIKDFDAGKEVRPGSIRLAIPKEYLAA